MRPRLLHVALLLAVLTAVAVGCGSSSTASDDGRLRVVVTTTQLADLTRAVGGDAVAVHQILQPNSDPHTYEPRPKDIQETAGASVVVTNGDGLDAWIGEVVDNAGGNPRVLDAGARRPVRLAGEDGGSEASRWDPHWWHDPRNAQAAVVAIHDALVAADPSARAVLDRNLTAELRRLRAMDSGIAACMNAVPAGERRLVTDHDAFDYFARRYGITVVGAVIPSQTTAAQPSAGDLADLTRTIRREHVKTVFAENSVNAKLAEAIARQTGATAGLTLYGDTLGEKGSPGATYIGMELANADAMVQGFTGVAGRCAPRPAA
jgi:zinc/manganese transport system substrate-binding protein